MKSRRFRKQLLGGAAKGILGTLALVGLSGQAQASSICTANTSTNPQTFNCTDDAVTPTASATGTFSAGATFAPGSTGRLEISSTGSLDVVLNGTINSTNVSDQYLTSAVYLTATGPLSYSNLGTTSGSSAGWLYNTYLRGDGSVSASTGTVVANGYRVTGVFSQALNGNNTLTGGTTTVSGVWSRGLWSDAYNGTNVTNTGTVTATGYLSRGVIARALPYDECVLFPGSLSTTVNVTGNVTADYVGITTLTCGNSVVNVQAGTTVAVTGTEGMAILNIGSRSANTNIAGSVLAASSAGRALDVRDGSSVTTISGTGVMSGTFDGDVGSDTLNIASGGIWTSAGTSDFRSGSDSVSNNGRINADAATFANLATFTNAGVLSISGGSFTLTGSTGFTNSGTIQVAQGATTITSDSALYNNGTINMQNGFAGDVLTISNNYVAGANAAFMIDVSGTTSDMFVVNGTTSLGMRAIGANPSQGSTQIFINAPAAINTNAILIGITQPGMNFVVGNQATRLIDLRLEQVKNSLYLTALPNALAFQPLIVGEVAQDSWYQSARVYSANAESLGGVARSPGKTVGFWGQLYAEHNNYGDRADQTAFGNPVEIDNHVRTDRSGAQIGVDVQLGSAIVAGVTGGYERAKASQRSLNGGFKTNGFNFGAYGRVGRTTGLYGSLLVKYDWSNGNLTNSAFDRSVGDPDFHSFGGEVGGGYRWNSGAMRFDLGASLSYVKTSIDSFSAEGIDYNFDSVHSLRGGINARVAFAGRKIVPFLNARLLHEFDGDSKLNLASGREADQVRANGGRTWVRIEAGLGGNGKSGPMLSGWAEAGDVKGIGIRGGWRF